VNLRTFTADELLLRVDTATSPLVAELARRVEELVDKLADAQEEIDALRDELDELEIRELEQRCGGLKQ
jgi:predicted RNase H-like nuclease (RuvC/YqgF family)